MAVVVGINIAISLRLTGFASAIPLAPLRRFYPLHWCGVALILLSGFALLLAYPAKALTNPVFYLKLLTLSSGLGISRYFQLHLSISGTAFSAARRTKLLAAGAILLWLITITAGRFLAYTHTVLLASRFY